MTHLLLSLPRLRPKIQSLLVIMIFFTIRCLRQNNDRYCKVPKFVLFCECIVQYMVYQDQEGKNQAVTVLCE